MFFDVILLNPQHRGEFGKAWVAATRGIRYLSKKEISAVDICKLCQHLLDFIATQTTSPQKRFSLRLSAILLNGTTRIFQKQVIDVQSYLCDLEKDQTVFTRPPKQSKAARIASFKISYILPNHKKLFEDAKVVKEAYSEVTAKIQEVRFTPMPGLILTPDIEEIYYDQLTPIAKVRTKRKPKKQVEASPATDETQAAQTYEVPEIRLPEVQDVLSIQPSSDLITLREEAPKAKEQAEEDIGMGELGTAMDLDSLLHSFHVQPDSQSPKGPPEPHIIQVVAQVHAEKDGPRVESKEEAVLIAEAQDKDSHIVIDITQGPTQEEKQAEAAKDKKKKKVSTTETPIIAEEIKPSSSEEIQVQQGKEVSKKKTPEGSSPEEVPAVTVARASSALREIQLPQEKESAKKKKETFDRSKIMFGKIIRRFIRINRCNPGEETYKYNYVPLPDEFRTAYTNFYQLFQVPQAEDEPLSLMIDSVESRGSLRRSALSILTVRERESLQEQGGTPKSLELRKTREHSSSEVTPQVLAGRSGSSLKHLSTEGVSLTMSPNKRLKPMDIDEPEIRELVTSREATLLPQPETEELSTMQFIEPALPQDETERRDLTSIQERSTEQQTIIEELPRRKYAKQPIPLDYRRRQQNIINIIVKWPFDRRYPTIEDVAEKPLNKLNIARAFHDLLALCSSKHLLLVPEENSLELKFIKKGPKLLI